jgi:hypothetical protein
MLLFRIHFVESQSTELATSLQRMSLRRDKAHASLAAFHMSNGAPRTWKYLAALSTSAVFNAACVLSDTIAVHMLLSESLCLKDPLAEMTCFTDHSILKRAATSASLLMTQSV